MEAIQERDGNNNPRVSYTLGGCLLARTDTNGSAYYHTDGNGDVTAMVDEQGRIKARYLYDPFGNLLASYGDLADANTRRFSSKEFHGKSGLYYYGFRWYDPNLQRWINADPIGLAGGRNKHAFVENDPVNTVDAYGLSPMSGSEAYIAALVAGQRGADVQAAVQRQRAVNDLAATRVGAAIVGAGITVGIGAAIPGALPGWAKFLVLTGAGATGGYVANGVENATEGRSFNQNGGRAAIFAGALTAGGYGVNRVFTAMSKPCAAATTTTAAKTAPRITEQGIARIEGHLGRPELNALSDPGNAAMLQRLRAGSTSPQDINFYMHELKESAIMNRGVGARDAHLQTLQWQGIPYKAGYESQLYHPSVIQQFPEYFNPAAHP